MDAATSKQPYQRWYRTQVANSLWGPWLDHRKLSYLRDQVQKWDGRFAESLWYSAEYQHSGKGGTVYTRLEDADRHFVDMRILPFV
eukprot:365016-Chlamydomonas_euryale.AAC.2